MDMSRGQSKKSVGRNYWMVVQSPENYEISRELNFSVHGVGSKYRRRAQRMQPDDRMLFYVRGMRKWVAVGSVTSHSFKDETPIWKPSRRGEDFGYRVKVKPAVILEEKDHIDALVLGPRLEYVKRWPPERWDLAFYDSLHLLPQRDFSLIEGEIYRASPQKRKRRRRDRDRTAEDSRPSVEPEATVGETDGDLSGQGSEESDESDQIVAHVEPPGDAPAQGEQPA